jgi:hypothetical protein
MPTHCIFGLLYQHTNEGTACLHDCLLVYIHMHLFICFGAHGFAHLCLPQTDTHTAEARWNCRSQTSTIYNYTHIHNAHTRIHYRGHRKNVDKLDLQREIDTEILVEKEQKIQVNVWPMACYDYCSASQWEHVTLLLGLTVRARDSFLVWSSTGSPEMAKHMLTHITTPSCTQSLYGNFCECMSSFCAYTWITNAYIYKMTHTKNAQICSICKKLNVVPKMLKNTAAASTGKWCRLMRTLTFTHIHM